MAAMALGLLGAGAYALYRTYVDQDALAGAGGGIAGGGIGMLPGSGRGRETSLAGRAGGRSGGRSHLLGGGTDRDAEAHPRGSAAANIEPAMAAAEEQLRKEGVPEASELWAKVGDGVMR
jgi:hypothetical protein